MLSGIMTAPCSTHLLGIQPCARYQEASRSRDAVTHGRCKPEIRVWRIWKSSPHAEPKRGAAQGTESKRGELKVSA